MTTDANFSGYPAGYSPWAAIQQALAPQMPGTPVSFPQMTPQQMSYGPMHSTLAEQLALALQAQMGGGLLGSPTPEQMGLLSTHMTPATARQMPISIPPTPAPTTRTGGLFNRRTTPTPPPAPAPEPIPLGPNEYYRLTSNFWDSMPKTLIGSVNPNKYV